METKIPSKNTQVNQKVKADFFVAMDGNDSWSGKLLEPNAQKTDGPFATLVRARDAIREMKGKECLKKPVTVIVRGGEYYFTETLVLSHEDSGTRDCPVTYTAYPGEKSILSGGKKITGWKPYKGKILQCELPEAKGGKWKFRQLFFNGKRQIRARYPNFDPNNPLYGGWAFMEGAAEKGSVTAFKYKSGTFKHHWSKPTEAEVNVFPAKKGWYNNIIPVKAIDEERHVITVRREVAQFDRSPWFVRVSFWPNNRFIVENVLEELDQPGEWYLDSEEGILYFWPPSDKIESTEVVAPVLDSLIDLGGVSWITISGFTFTETTDGDDYHREGCLGVGAMFPRQGWKYCGETLHLKGSEHCCIENNHFYAVGGNAVYLEGYNARNCIRNNEISYAGTNGVCLLGSQERHPMFNQVSDNHIHHCGVINKYCAGVFLGLSEGNVISHNYIHHMPHHAINLGNSGFGRNIVEYNEIRHSSLEIYDTGAINCWMEDPSGSMIKKDAERSGHIIRYNLIADTWGCKVEEGKIVTPDIDTTFAIYMDNGTSNCFVYGNVVVRSGSGIAIQSGKNNVVENNIIMDCHWHMRYLDTVVNWAPYMAGFMTGNRFCRNILYSTYPDTYLFHLWAWGESASADWHDKMIAQSDENLFFNASSGNYRLMDHAGNDMLFAEWQKMGYDINSVISDPLFVDTKHDDYCLKPDSPALKLGFQPIDTTKVGLRIKRKREICMPDEESIVDATISIF